MGLSQCFQKASAELEEITRRNRLAIDQKASLCAGSQRELDASYALLRQGERSLGETPPPSANRRTGPSQ